MKKEKFSRARTAEQVNLRQREIMNACRSLFLAGGYENVNLKAIGEMTSFTRPTIYNYYKTKEEIMLDLLIGEMLDWAEDFGKKVEAVPTATKEQYSLMVTESVMEYDLMLQLFSLLYTVLEKNSCMEKIIDFKHNIMEVIQVLAISVGKYFQLDAKKTEEFISAFFALILGLHPMAYITEKQEEALAKSGIPYTPPDFASTLQRGIVLLLG